jgi:hypothetical protein
MEKVGTTESLDIHVDRGQTRIRIGHNNLQWRSAGISNPNGDENRLSSDICGLAWQSNNIHLGSRAQNKGTGKARHSDNPAHIHS